ncbi:MAG: PTS system mannose/fructose/sorbose family transporter subunit IID [Gemmatimonadales bacterium]
MSALRRAMFRLLSIQGTWNYERMVGTGMAYAAEPLLEDLKEKDPARYQAAMVRAGEFFNSHPYLAGLALGAAVRAEYEGVPGPQIQRLRTALCSPLGALGDQVFWTGVLPALVGVALALAAAGHAVIGVVAFAVIYNALRLYTGSWALRTGLATGMQVGRAIGDSWLSRLARLVGPLAGFAVGFAVPLVVRWLLWLGPAPERWVAVPVALVGLGLSLRFGAAVTSVRFALAALILTVGWRWLAG